jgi:hypothetical protein
MKALPSTIDKVQRKKMSEILSREKELIFGEAKKGYRRSFHPELNQHVQPIGEIDSTEWDRFVEYWKTELICALQRSCEPQNDTELLRRLNLEEI